MIRKYPISHYFHEEYLKRLNSKNVTIQQQAIMGRRYRVNSQENDDDEFDMEEERHMDSVIEGVIDDVNDFL